MGLFWFCCIVWSTLTSTLLALSNHTHTSQLKYPRFSDFQPSQPQILDSRKCSKMGKTMTQSSTDACTNALDTVTPHLTVTDPCTQSLVVKYGSYFRSHGSSYRRILVLFTTQTSPQSGILQETIGTISNRSPIPQLLLLKASQKR